MNREVNQQRHVQLIDFLNRFELYNGRFKIIERERVSDEFQFISTNEINQAVKILTNVLNLNGGSVSDVDLYKLLQVYFQSPEYREKINVILNDSTK